MIWMTLSNIIPCRYKTWMRFVWQISMKLESSSNQGFFLHQPSEVPLRVINAIWSGHPVTNEVFTLCVESCVVLHPCISLACFIPWSTFLTHSGQWEWLRMHGLNTLEQVQMISQLTVSREYRQSYHIQFSKIVQMFHTQCHSFYIIVFEYRRLDFISRYIS